MKHLFLNKELSLLAKEKGFKEPCFAYWYGEEFIPCSVIARDAEFVPYSNYEDSDNPTAPLYQQIIDWLLIKHKTQIGELPIKEGDYRKWFINLTDEENGFKGGYIDLDKTIEEAFKLI